MRSALQPIDGNASIVTRKEKLARTPVGEIKSREQPVDIVTRHEKLARTPVDEAKPRQQSQNVYANPNIISKQSKLASTPVADTKNRRQSIKERRDSIMELVRPWGLLHPDDFKQMIDSLSDKLKVEIVETLEAIAAEELPISPAPIISTTVVVPTTPAQDIISSEFQVLGSRFLKVLRESMSPQLMQRIERQPTPNKSASKPSKIPTRKPSVPVVPSAQVVEPVILETEQVDASVVFNPSRRLMRTPPGVHHVDPAPAPSIPSATVSSLHTQESQYLQTPLPLPGNYPPLLLYLPSYPMHAVAASAFVPPEPQVAPLEASETVPPAPVSVFEAFVLPLPPATVSVCERVVQTSPIAPEHMDSLSQRLVFVESVLKMNQTELQHIKAEREMATQFLREEALRRQQLEKTFNNLEIDMLDARIAATKESLSSITSKLELLELQQRTVDEKPMQTVLPRKEKSVRPLLIEENMPEEHIPEEPVTEEPAAEEFAADDVLDCHQSPYAPQVAVSDSPSAPPQAMSDSPYAPPAHFNASPYFAPQALSDSPYAAPSDQAMSTTPLAYSYTPEASSAASSAVSSAMEDSPTPSDKSPSTPLIHGYLRLVPMKSGVPDFIPYGDSSSPTVKAEKTRDVIAKKPVNKRLFSNEDKEKSTPLKSKRIKAAAEGHPEVEVKTKRSDAKPREIKRVLKPKVSKPRATKRASKKSAPTAPAEETAVIIDEEPAVNVPEPVQAPVEPVVVPAPEPVMVAKETGKESSEVDAAAGYERFTVKYLPQLKKSNPLLKKPALLAMLQDMWNVMTVAERSEWNSMEDAQEPTKPQRAPRSKKAATVEPQQPTVPFTEAVSRKVAAPAASNK